MKNFAYLCLLLGTLDCAAQSPIYPYSDGHLWGLTNANREVIAPPQFDTSFYFDGVHYAIAVKNKKYGTIGRDGKTLLPFTYDNIIYIRHNFGLGEQNNKSILLNLDADKPVTPEAFDSVDSYCECPAQQFVVSKGGKKIIISGSTGNRLGKTEYEDVTLLPDIAKAIVQSGGKHGVIDSKTGNWVIPAKYDWISRSWYNGEMVFELTANKQSLYFDNNGNPIKKKKAKPVEDEGIVAPPDYGGVVDAAQKELYIYNLGNNNWKLSEEMRSTGSTQVFQTYDLQGYTAVEKLTYSDWNNRPSAVIKAVKGGRTGLIGLKGEELAPFEYDNIELIEGEVHYYKTTLNNKTGVITPNLVVLKKPVLKRVLRENYRFSALLVEMPGGQLGYMDNKTGKIYIPGIEE
jgi:hypothetical protein